MKNIFNPDDTRSSHSTFFRQAVPVAKCSHSLSFSKTKTSLEKAARPWQQRIDPRGHPEPANPNCAQPPCAPCLGLV